MGEPTAKSGAAARADVTATHAPASAASSETSANVATATAARGDSWPPPVFAWTALVLLMAAVVISSCDRAIMILLVEPIKAEHHLTDTQFGALQGIAFGAFYIVAAVPLGVLADRSQRRLVIGFGVGLFSCFSLMTGLARNYTQLFVARAGVGFGEASVSPGGYSMISDYFPPKVVGRATSMFSMCSFVGGSVALIGGGMLYGWFKAQAAAPAGPFLGLAPWKATIICMALPGVLLTPLLFLMREPPRRGLVGNKRNLSWGELGDELGQRRRFLLLITAAMTMASMMTNATSTWTPALFIRVYGWSATEAGVRIGMAMLVFAVLGSLLAGWTVDWLTTRRRPDGPITIAAFSFLAAGAFGVAAPLMPTGGLALSLLAPVWFLKPMCFATAPLALQIAIPNQLRAQVMAAYLTVLNIVGFVLGPIIAGVMTDHLFSRPSDVRYSIALIMAITAPLMVAFMLLARRPFVEIRAAAEA